MQLPWPNICCGSGAVIAVCDRMIVARRPPINRQARESQRFSQFLLTALTSAGCYTTILYTDDIP